GAGQPGRGIAVPAAGERLEGGDVVVIPLLEEEPGRVGRRAGVREDVVVELEVEAGEGALGARVIRGLPGEEVGHPQVPRAPAGAAPLVRAGAAAGQLLAHRRGLPGGKDDVAPVRGGERVVLVHARDWGEDELAGVDPDVDVGVAAGRGVDVFGA